MDNNNNNNNKSYDDEKVYIKKYNNKLLNLNELAQWRTENPWILSGYRPISNSIRDCLKSLLYLHNESVNIYTHLIPGLLLLSLLFFTGDYIFIIKYPKASFNDRIIFISFLSGATICFIISSIYHTFMSHSKLAHDYCLKFDFVGILILTCMNFISGEYVAFKCYPLSRNILWTMIIISVISASYIVLNPKYQSIEYRTLRTITFISLGVSALFPIIHMYILNKDNHEIGIRTGIYDWLTELLILISVVILFLYRIPERLFPGKLDYFGSSHQIFHIGVLLSFLAHLKGLWTVYDVEYFDPTCNI